MSQNNQNQKPFICLPEDPESGSNVTYAFASEVLRDVNDAPRATTLPVTLPDVKPCCKVG